jgi:hypothetical protein
MPRRKKRAYSTNRDSARKITPAVASDPVGIFEAKTVEVEPVEKSPKVRAKFTLDEAIEWFRKDPHPEEFFCTGPPGFALVQGDHYLKFEKGQFVTSDPVEVEILMRSREFNLFIYVVNANLRNLRE